MKIKYFIDEKIGLYYERQIGKDVSISEFQKELLNPEHMHTAFLNKMIIVDMRHLSINLDDKEAFDELFKNHAEVLENSPSVFKKFAVLISHTNELLFAAPLKKQLQRTKDVRSKFFLDEAALKDYIGFDVSSYFALKDNELKEFITE